jgi:hypothetical protein
VPELRGRDFLTCHARFPIDGGRSYVHLNYKTRPPTLELEVEQTADELFDDYRTGTDKFGLIKNQ